RWIVKSLHRINIAGPGLHAVSVGKDVPGVIQDNVLDDVDTVLVRGLYEFAQIVARSEVGIDFEKILHAIAVIGQLKRNLFENGSDPQRGHAHAPQITYFAGDASWRASH